VFAIGNNVLIIAGSPLRRGAFSSCRFMMSKAMTVLPLAASAISARSVRRRRLARIGRSPAKEAKVITPKTRPRAAYAGSSVIPGYGMAFAQSQAAHLPLNCRNSSRRRAHGWRTRFTRRPPVHAGTPERHPLGSRYRLRRALLTDVDVLTACSRRGGLRLDHLCGRHREVRLPKDKSIAAVRHVRSFRPLTRRRLCFGVVARQGNWFQRRLRIRCSTKDNTLRSTVTRGVLGNLVKEIRRATMALDLFSVATPCVAGEIPAPLRSSRLPLRTALSTATNAATESLSYSRHRRDQTHPFIDVRSHAFARGHAACRTLAHHCSATAPRCPARGRGRATPGPCQSAHVRRGIALALAKTALLCRE